MAMAKKTTKKATKSKAVRAAKKSTAVTRTVSTTKMMPMKSKKQYSNKMLFLASLLAIISAILLWQATNWMPR